MMRILIVEDEEHLARLVAEVLGREGYAAEVVGDGRMALAPALVEPFDLLVLDWMLPDPARVPLVKRARAVAEPVDLSVRDWMLPGLDGVQIVKRLRAADVGVPILMLTARSQVEDR